VRSETCPYCASPNVFERPPAAHRPRPELVVAFTGDAAAARRRLELWLGSRTWFADAADQALLGSRTCAACYVPAYLYSAVAHTSTTASIGEHYTEIETHEATDAEGKKRTRDPAA